MEDLADQIISLGRNVYLVLKCIPPPHVLDLISERVEKVYSVQSPDYVEIWVECGDQEPLVHGVNVEYEGGLSHEALSGYPRVHIDLYKFIVLPERLKKAMLTHELVHVLLHGSPEFYTGIAGTVREILLLHAAYTIVKDLEVAMWMEKSGFHEDNTVLRDYFDSIELTCATLEEIMDEGRRLAIHAALGSIPRFKCDLISKKLYDALVKMLRCKPRPWDCRTIVRDLLFSVA